MSEAEFRLTYDGDAVADGEMDVADLAPALLAMGQLLKASARVVDGDDAVTTVRVKATQVGSFDVWLSLAMDGARAGWAFWKSDDVQAAAALLGLLGFSGVGLIQYLKTVRGRTIDAAVRDTAGNVEVTLNETTIVVPQLIFQLSVDQSVRAALENVVATPLDKDGIDEVRIGTKEWSESIGKDDAYSFRAPLAQEGDELVNRHRRTFSIVTLSFKSGQKWKLSDGHGSPKYVTMSDADFVQKVDRSEVRFAKGDLLICEVIERSRLTPSGFKSEYEIIKVIEHRPAPTQAPFGF